MEDEKQLEPLERDKIKLTTDEEDSTPSNQLIVFEQDQLETISLRADKPWLLIPRINGSVPGAERLLYRPNIILGAVFGIILPFILLHLGLTYHDYLNTYLNTYMNSGLLITAILLLFAQFKINRYFTFRFRNPFFVEFAFGVMYPVAKLLSFVGLGWLEATCYVTLGDCMQEFNHQAYTAECNAKVLSHDKPLKVFHLGAEREYAQSLLLSGQSQRAIHYVEERIRYFKNIIEQSGTAKDQLLTDYALRCYFASIIYESTGDFKNAAKLKEEAFERVKTCSRLQDAYNTGVLCKAENLYSDGKFEDATKMLEEYFDRYKMVVWNELASYSSFMKARAAICLARCYWKLGDDTKMTEYAYIAKTETKEDRSIINRLNEQFMLAEIVHSQSHIKEARDVLTGIKDNFLSDQSCHVSILLRQKAEELGCADLFLELPEHIHPEENASILCKHHKEECSYVDGPVKIVSEMGIGHRSLLIICVAGLLPFLAHLFNGDVTPMSMRYFCIVLVPILIYLAWAGYKKSKKMTRLRKSIVESPAIPVKVDFDGLCNIEIIEYATKSFIGKYGINDSFRDALHSRIVGGFPAKMYKQGDEILGLEIFGYVTMVSKPKK